MPKRKWSIDEFKEAIKDSYSIAESLRKLDVNGGGSYQVFRRYIKLYNVDISHFKNKPSDLIKYAHSNKKEAKSINELTNINSAYSTKYIKKRLLDENIFEYKCSICNISNWLNNELSLHLDHINGNDTDHRIENLRLLCPNCHSQTDTYCGKNVRKKNIESGKTKKEYNCAMCNIQIYKNSTWCRKCSNLQPRKKKIDWPSIEELNYMIENLGSVVAVAKKLGVSDNAIKKHIKSNTKLNIASPAGLDPAT